MRKRFLLLAVILSLTGSSVLAEPDFNPAILNPAGTLNTHDMDTLRRFEQEKQEEKDFERYKENNAQKEEHVKKKKKIKVKVEKAEVDEYATKGVYVENIIISPSYILTEEELKEIV